MGDVLISSGFLQIENPDARTTKTVTEIAKRHLLAYVGEETSDAFDRLVQSTLSPDSTLYGLYATPDRYLEVQKGAEWLRTTPTKSDVLEQLRLETGVGRATTFVFRSFLYMAFGESNGLVFVPDAVQGKAAPDGFAGCITSDAARRY